MSRVLSHASGTSREEVAHLPGRLEVVLGPVELEPVGVRQQRPGLDAEQGVVGHRVLTVGVVAVVGGQQRCVQPAGDLDQLRVGALLFGQAVVLDLDEEVLPPEDVLQAGGPALGLHLVAGQQGLEHHPAQAAGGGDQPAVMALEQLPVQPGLVVVPLQVGGRGQLQEVAVALDGLGQQGQVVVELLPALDVAPGVVHLAPAHRTLVAGLGRPCRPRSR